MTGSSAKGSLLILGAAVLVVAFALAIPVPAHAHGFGERYDLPLPLSLFVIAGAVAVALSFVVAAVFLRAGANHARYPRYNLLRLAPVRWVASSPFTATLKTLSVVLTLYVIVGALIGNERAALNPAPAAIYVAFWVGLSFFTALFGNLWALVNPWKAAWGFLERAFEALAPGSRLSLHRRYPARIGPWPAVLVFAGFAILETVAADTAGPRALGWILVLYTAYNFVGMYVYGREVWLRNAEGFTVVYGFMARFSVTEVRSSTSRCRRCTSDGRCSSGESDCVDCYECYARTAPAQRQFNLRPPCVGLNRLGVVTLTVVVHVILLLSTVSFDGLSATPEWLVFTGQFLLQSPQYGGYIANLIGALGLPVVFGLLFALTCAAIAALSGQTEPDPGQLLRRFTFSLLPIALAYHFRPLPRVPAHQRPAVHRSGFRPVRLGLGPVRHGGRHHQYRHPVAGVHLVFLDFGHCGWAHRRRVPGARAGDADLSDATRRAAQPTPHAGPDGVLHLREFMDNFTPYRRMRADLHGGCNGA